MNASDDRSPEVLRETIARAMQSNNIDNNHRPNCVVLDEIDGVDGKASIDMLVRIINTPMRTKSTLSTEISGTHTNVEEEEENDIGNRPRKKNKADMLLLTRPIICICNDLYAPALRELRKYAEVFHFTAPTDQRLCQRLRHILLTEGVQLSPGILPLLNSLCLSTGLDIRSSINYLQFATQQASYEQNVSKSNDAPKLGVILESILCKTLKDERLDTNGIWRDIFFGGGTTISTASNNKLSTSSEGTAATESMFTRVMNAVTSYNDHNLILAGIYENLPHVRSDTGVNSISWRHGKKDSFMQRESCAISWLSCVDSIMHYSYTNPNSYHLQQYVPLVASATYLYCCAKPSSSSKVIYPKKVFYEKKIDFF